MESPSIVNNGFDPTAIPVPRAGMDDIDPDALSFARREFGTSCPQAESDDWSDERFLEAMGLIKDGVPTHAAMILLGREDVVHKMCFRPCMRWILKDRDGAVLDGRIYRTPFLLSVEGMCGNVRDLTHSVFLGDDLTKTNFRMYDHSLLREALYNCVCHQDYLMDEPITLIEFEDRLVFDNRGSFLPGDASEVLTGPPVSICRNGTLAEAMRRMGFIDLRGEGIRRMYRNRVARLFPLPDFDVSEGRVTLTVPSKITDEAYASILRRRKDITMSEIILLDAFSKDRPISDADLDHLIERGFVSDRWACPCLIDPRFGDEEDHDSEEMREKILDILSFRGPSHLREILVCLWGDDYCMDVKAYDQTSHVLGALRREGLIVNKGTFKKPVFAISDENEDPGTLPDAGV